MQQHEHRQCKGVPELKQSKQKEQAVAFYAQHNVTGALETLLNTMYLEAPEDVYGYMSEYFHGLSKTPVISDIQGMKELDDNGEMSLALTIFCKINGIEKAVCTYTHPIHTMDQEEGQGKTLGQLSPPRNQDAKQVSPNKVSSPPKDAGEESNQSGDRNEDEGNSIDVEKLDTLIDKLQDLSPKDQCSVDAKLLEIASDQQMINQTTLTALSHVTSLCYCALSNTPLFLHLSKTFNAKDHLSLPLPLMAVINGGQTGTGKLKVRSFCIAPSSSCGIVDGTRHVTKFYQEIGRQLAAKQGPVGFATFQNGAYCMTADKPEQVLDLLREAGVQSGLELNREVSLFIDIGAEMIFDEEKKKYEIISGQWKTGEDLVAIYSGLLSNYPGLIGFIDPLHPKDSVSWNTLIDQLGNKCLLITDRTTRAIFPTHDQTDSDNSDEKESKTNLSPISFITCSAVSSRYPLLSNCFAEINSLMDKCRYLMLSVSGQQTCDSLNFATELAVALQCKFIKLGAPTGLVSAVALSKLIQIQQQLEKLSLQCPPSALLFSCIKDTT